MVVDAVIDDALLSLHIGDGHVVPVEHLNAAGETVGATAIPNGISPGPLATEFWPKLGAFFGLHQVKVK